MKKKNRTRAYVHDRLYLLADKLLKRHNPCHDCVVHNCHNDSSPARCCVGCPHFGPTGCTVKALYCKLWLCYPEQHRNPQLVARLDQLITVARQYNLLVARGSRDETLKHGIRLRFDPWALYFKRPNREHLK